jgi:hypothetical protein
MLFFLLIFTLDINSALPYSKLFEFALLLEILDIVSCLLLVLHAKVVPSLDVYQPQIQCSKMLTWLLFGYAAVYVKLSFCDSNLFGVNFPLFNIIT